MKIRSEVDNWVENYDFSVNVIYGQHPTSNMACLLWPDPLLHHGERYLWIVPLHIKRHKKMKSRVSVRVLVVRGAGRGPEQ